MLTQVLEREVLQQYASSGDDLVVVQESDEDEEELVLDPALLTLQDCQVTIVAFCV